MPRGHNIAPEVREEALRLCRAFVPRKDVAARLGVNKDTVSHWAARAGIPSPQHNPESRAHTPRASAMLDLLHRGYYDRRVMALLAAVLVRIGQRWPGSVRWPR